MIKNLNPDINLNDLKTNVANVFGQLLSIQNSVSSLSNPEQFSQKPSNADFAEMGFALTGEVFELIQEIGWKSWKKNGEITDEKRNKILGEFGDVLAFLLLLMDMMGERFGFDDEELAQAYFDTCQKNINRFNGTSGEEGYG